MALRRAGSERGAPSPGSLEALWKQSGQQVALIPGTNDYAPGDLRISFLVVDNRGRLVAPPRARFWIARSLAAKPFQQTVARLEPVGVAGVSKVGGRAVSVRRARTRERAGNVLRAGSTDRASRDRWDARSAREEARRLAGSRIARLSVGDSDACERAWPSSEDHDARSPDRGLLRYSIAESLRAHIPFVVTFATPRYCSSRTCGPVVDVVDRTRRRLAKDGSIRFIHVEIYQDNDPRKGENRWVREWRLPSEPWTFLVGRDGRIKAKFEGSISPRELESAVRRLLHA